MAPGSDSQQRWGSRWAATYMDGHTLKKVKMTPDLKPSDGQVNTLAFKEKN